MLTWPKSSIRRHGGLRYCNLQSPVCYNLLVNGPLLLLINPWIDDFTSFDFWAKPLGLLYLAGLLRQGGYEVKFIDCLDTHYPGIKSEPGLMPAARREFGTGKFYRRKIPKPSCFKDIPRYYYRHGLSERLFLEALTGIERPSAILVTSGMTYWYTGVFEAIRLSKQTWPGVPVVLGGIYATLCTSHARANSGADFVVPGPGEQRIFCVLEEATGARPSTPSPPHHAPSFPRRREPFPDDLPYPAFDLLRRIDYVCLLTSRGCPFRCSYCASPLLQPDFARRKPENVVEEILFWHRMYGVKDFAFYDDALLLDAERHIIPILEGVLRSGTELRFHTPNGLHARYVNPRLAALMRQTGFQAIRLGLETATGPRWDSKTDLDEFTTAVRYLNEAGFRNDQLVAYLLMGLPGQEPAAVAAAIAAVKGCGVNPYLSEYSPIPGTPLWPEAVRCSRYDLQNEPLTHNNSAMPCLSEGFTWEDVRRLKQLARTD
ncbi:MAG: radical SAM protein [Chloroflexi bacterium]|nr:radical SAM protein [Chloroflexota bacterium]